MSHSVEITIKSVNEIEAITIDNEVAEILFPVGDTSGAVEGIKQWIMFNIKAGIKTKIAGELLDTYIDTHVISSS